MTFREGGDATAWEPLGVCNSRADGQVLRPDDAGQRHKRTDTQDRKNQSPTSRHLDLSSHLGRIISQSGLPLEALRRLVRIVWSGAIPAVSWD